MMARASTAEPGGGERGGNRVAKARIRTFHEHVPTTVETMQRHEPRLAGPATPKLFANDRLGPLTLIGGALVHEDACRRPSVGHADHPLSPEGLLTIMNDET